MATITLGTRIRDRITGIEGVFIAHTEWWDRTNECAIQRKGLDADGEPFAIFWCPFSRVDEV